MDITTLLSDLLALGGVAALIAVLINVLKYFNIVTDGNAQTWSTGLNIVALALLFLAKVFSPDIIPVADSFANTLAQLGVVLLTLLTQFGVSKFAHYTLRGVPVIGKTFS